MASEFLELTLSVALTKIEKVEAIAFIERIMRMRFGCDPPPTTGIILVARMEGVIVGSIVLEGIGRDYLFPIEKHYEFDTSTTPFPFNREIIVQGSRWIATKEKVSFVILRASFELAYGLGKRYMLIEAKPYSVKRLIELGVTCKAFEKTALALEKIKNSVGDDGLKYFIEEPFPTLYMIDLEKSLLSFR
jgi:hypothetical protein